VPFGHALDFILTFQVKSTGSRSHEAMRHLQHHLRPGAGGTLGNGMPLYPVPFTKGNHLFSLQIHAVLLVEVPRIVMSKGRATGSGDSPSRPLA
jgi:hypothetical protein